MLDPRLDAGPALAAIGAVAVLGAASFTWIYGASLTYYNGPPIRSDGIGYYVYLPAVFLDHDVTLEQTAARSFDGNPAQIPGVRRVPPRSRLLDTPSVPQVVPAPLTTRPFGSLGK